MNRKNSRLIVVGVAVATVLVLAIVTFLGRAEGPETAQSVRSLAQSPTPSARQTNQTAHLDRPESGRVAPSGAFAPPDGARGGDDAAQRPSAATQLGERVLLSQEEIDDLHDWLSDPGVIGHARDLLLTDRPETLTPDDQERRMDAVQLLSDALRWKENPIRADVLAACRRVVLSDVYHRITDEAARQSVAADRFELYLALDNMMPEEAAKLAKEAEASPNAKLLAHSASVASALRPSPIQAGSSTKQKETQ